jgi:hypothetical protein
MRVPLDECTVLEIGPGEAYVIEPGHDAEVAPASRSGEPFLPMPVPR